ncbi:hypothetical protein NG895_24195 [Aeoliella sp. ICT_H6.2]|uniref:Uncharacterized protein n=1 Tax=Aeoliella straminimaris TaxID=2954799 RepID=A0A9X2FDD9_9BACT|nr:hypothetical protein [Aeoliella straminimaris]MCO6047012.1 hypothetical protein [Aeoliella straminimaris]
MSNEPDDSLIVQVRTMQIIVFAMATGCVMFAIIALVIVDPQPPNGPPMISWIAAAMGLVGLIAGTIVPRLLAVSQPATGAGYQTLLIVGLALYEGAAFFNLVAFLVEGQMFSLAVAVVLIAAIVMALPTVGRVQDWIDARQRRAEEAEAFSRR